MWAHPSGLAAIARATAIQMFDPHSAAGALYGPPPQRPVKVTPAEARAAAGLPQPRTSRAIGAAR